MSRQLPPGKTCDDCKSAQRCVWLLGESFSYSSRQCDWDPSKFVPVTDVARRQS